MTRSNEDALALFDALCERRLRDLVDAELVGELVDAFAVPGRAADAVTRFVAPARARVLPRLGSDGSRVRDAIPGGVFELLVALLPSIPPPKRELVERLIGTAEVRAEVRRLLEETVRDLVRRAPAGGERSRGVIGWGARAASAAGRSVVALGGALGADLESKIGEAVDAGVSLAQARIVDAVSSAENARRLGKELARFLPRVADVPEAEVARAGARLPYPILDGLFAAVISHNAARPAVRALIVDEAAAFIAQASETTLGELLDRFGLRAPIRAAFGRRGGAIVEAARARSGA